ncbi:MAG: VWA domain-containing protein [Candidatus Schekmanbacteria bacterium]|nr:MAG: VWA domain-containing protein [Candidatus Schekmanbacteria bacterium]
MLQLRFETPLFFLLLLLIPIMYWFGRLWDKKPRITVPSVEILKEKEVNPYFIPKNMKFILRSLVLIFLIISASGPQIGRYVKETTTKGIDIILAIDTSRSMNAMDFSIGGSKVTRLEAVKRVVRDFVEERNGDRIGMVVFGEEAFTQCPLTIDYGMLLYYLEKLKVGIAGDATSIGTAIALAVKKLKDSQSQSKVIILLTDGRNNSGRTTPLMAAEIASLFGIRVYTIGVGGKGKAPFLIDDLGGKTLVFREVDLDEDTLKKISGITNAVYFNAKKTAMLSDVFKEINSIEKVDIKVKKYFNGREIYHYFLLCALVLFLVEIILMNTLFKEIP